MAGHLERAMLKLSKGRCVQEERAGWQEDLRYDKSLNKSDSVRNGKAETLQETRNKNNVWV